MKTKAAHDFWIAAISTVAIGFGLMTIVEGGAVLFGGDAAQAAAGAYVPFVLWFNFLAGFAYVIAGAGLWMRRRWAVKLAIGIAVSTLLVFAAFAVHVVLGGAYLQRTPIAMTLRSVIWIAIARIGSWRLGRLRTLAVHD